MTNFRSGAAFHKELKKMRPKLKKCNQEIECLKRTEKREHSREAKIDQNAALRAAGTFDTALTRKLSDLGKTSPVD